MKAVGYLATIVMVTVGGGCVYGFTVSHLWGWFIVPAFHLPELGLVNAVGLGLLASLMTKEHPEPREKMTLAESLGVGAVKILLNNGMALLAGYCWSRFL
jgi:hypothetical protein